MPNGSPTSEQYELMTEEAREQLNKFAVECSILALKQAKTLAFGLAVDTGPVENPWHTVIAVLRDEFLEKQVVYPALDRFTVEEAPDWVKVLLARQSVASSICLLERLLEAGRAAKEKNSGKEIKTS